MDIVRDSMTILLLIIFMLIFSNYNDKNNKSFLDMIYTLSDELNNTNCPYPMIQYYDWRVFNENDEIVSINYWGVVTAKNPCSCVIVGTYKLNPRVRIYINLSITD